jgi:ribonuclease P protein subunit RPR2
MVKSRYAKPASWRRIAKERISILFKEADKEFRKHPERSKRYVELAKKIGMRYKVRIPKDLKRRFCSKCLSYLKPGVNCRVRTRKEKRAVTVTCLVCGSVSRHPYIREKQNIKQ